jgi:tetratricopeptide (TPR) repeat protein
MRSFCLKILFLTVVGMAAISAYGQARTVTVVSQPEAIIWIDGVRFGKAGNDGKLTIKTLSAGPHSLRVRADGYKETSQPLTAVQKGEVKIDLVKTTDDAELSYQEAERLTGSDREKSAAAYRKAIKLRPRYPEAYLGLARVLSDAGDQEEALKAITSAKRQRPGYAEASAVEGRIYKENGEENKAIAAYKRAIAEGKGFQPEAYAGLGLLYKEKAETAGSGGDFEEETANYTEAAKNLKLAIKQLSGAPDCIIMYQLLGLIYEKQKRNPDAIALYEEFLQLFPETVEATAVRSFIVQLKKQ